MSEEKFKSLMRQLEPVLREADSIRKEMMELSHKMNLDIVRKAFPGAAVIKVTPLAEIKPTDLSRGATETVASLVEHKLSPSLIIVDEGRKVLLLAAKQQQ